MTVISDAGHRVGRRTNTQREQDAYLATVQGMYKSYCFFVHNQTYLNNPDAPLGDIKWYPSKFHKYVCDSVQEFIETETSNAYDILIINTPPQHGKQLDDETPILTRNGWKRHGDLVVGDEVLNHMGDWVKVTKIFPKYEQDCKVTFTNGEEIYCHENHEWLVYDRSIHKETIRETKYMESRISYGSQEKKRGHRYNFMLPNREFVSGDEKDLAVPPYVLGVWLGDGTNTAGQICACPEDRITIDECRKFYPEGKEWRHSTTGVISATLNGLYKDLQVYGMCHSRKRTEKHIPDEYLTASIEQRLELLAGLIDTDGSVDKKHNRVVFTTADEKLKDTFEQLIATFGWRTSTFECKPVPSSSGVQGKRGYWQIGFNPTTHIPCRVDRKRLYCFAKQRRIAISNIERVSPRQGNCISVEGGIYLCGRKLIPTHNSTTITETLPSWYFMKHPDNSVIEVSYGDDLAERFGKRNLEKVKEFGHLFGVEVDPKKCTSKEFQIKGHRGRMISKGIGSGLTGHSGHLIVIDDPIKNREQADSQRTRDSVWNEFNDSILSRTQAGSKIILIMTRWHEDDLAGRIMREMPEKATLINLECECETPNDPLGRKTKEENGTDVGDALCPEIGKDNNWLRDFKHTFITQEAGIRSWYALYQGKPTTLEGNILKKDWWQFYSKEEHERDNVRYDTMLMSVDASFKDGEKNDYVAISVWGKIGAKIYLIEMVNEHLNFVSTIRKIKVLRAKYPQVGITLIEDKANGTAIIQTLKSEIMGIMPVSPDLSKEARVNAISFYIECGNVYLPKDANWTFDFIEQCAKFPNDVHDDMVDSMSQALSRLVRTKTMRRLNREAKKGSFFNTVKQKAKAVGVGEKIHIV